MPIQGTVKTLYSDEEKQNAIFPITVLNAVTDEDGNTVEDLIDGKQDVLVFNTTYDPMNNKVATMADVSSAIVSAIEEGY